MTGLPLRLASNMSQNFILQNAGGRDYFDIPPGLSMTSLQIERPHPFPGTLKTNQNQKVYWPYKAFHSVQDVSSGMFVPLF